MWLIVRGAKTRPNSGCAVHYFNFFSLSYAFYAFETFEHKLAKAPFLRPIGFKCVAWSSYALIWFTRSPLLVAESSYLIRLRFVSTDISLRLGDEWVISGGHDVGRRCMSRRRRQTRSHPEPVSDTVQTFFAAALWHSGNSLRSDARQTTDEKRRINPYNILVAQNYLRRRRRRATFNLV